MSELFNAAHLEIQTHQLTSKIYKIVFIFKIVRKSARNVAALKLTTIFDSRLIFQGFSNLVHQICFEILIYYDSTNKAISISIEFTYFFSYLFCVLMSLRCHRSFRFLLNFFKFISSSTVIFIGTDVFSTSVSLLFIKSVLVATSFATTIFSVSVKIALLCSVSLCI